MMVNLLQAGKKDIENAIRWQGLELELEICVKEIDNGVAQKDIKRLMSVFEDLEIIKRKK